MSTAEILQLVALVVALLVYITTGVAFVVRSSAGSKELREDIRAMQDELRNLAKVVTTQAVHTERLNEQSRRMTMLEQRVEDLRRGRGYVTERDQMEASVDREYP